MLVFDGKIHAIGPFSTAMKQITRWFPQINCSGSVETRRPCRLMADTSKEKMGCFETHAKGRWRKAPIGHAFTVLLAPGASPATSSSLAAATDCQHDEGPGDDEGPGMEASFAASPSTQHDSNECGGAQPDSEAESDDKGAQSFAEDLGLESEKPHKRERHLYMSDEQIFASFSSKRKYEREWRHKKKKKGGKKHRKKNEQKSA